MRHLPHGESGRSGGVYQSEKPTLLDYCCLSQGVPPRRRRRRHCGWRLRSSNNPEPSQRLGAGALSLRQAVGNPPPLMWELKGAAFSAAVQTTPCLLLPQHLHQGPPWWLRSHSAPQPAGGTGGVWGGRVGGRRAGGGGGSLR